MVATAPKISTIPMNRLGYDSPPATLPELPKTARERGFLWSDVVFQAVMALQKQLTHQNADIAAAAANSILELERTRMRHSTHVAGSESVSTAQLEFEEEEREVEERQVERRAEYAAATKAAPVAQPELSLNEQALAAHAREAADAFEKMGEKLPIRPEHFVARLLKLWRLEPAAIPAGEFMRHFKKLGVGHAPASQPAGGSHPQSA